MADASLVEKYRRILAQLLPVGRAWESVKEDASKLLKALGTEFARVDERSSDLLAEFDPGTSTELLSDWEQLLGLPDECSPLAPDLNQRRQQARQKLAAIGGTSKLFYEQVASNLGFDAVVSDYKAFRVGFSRVGDRLTNPFDPDKDVFRVGRNRVGDQLKIHGWRYIFEVNVEASVVEPFRVGVNRVGQPLVNFGNDIMECTMAKLKPAHTGVFFTFRAP